uniref:Transient receptor potential cation channel, subfamily M, member 2 n=1 Tax=Nothobranchius rachovii TaxID=451742 RepID=A0A1A8PBL2_9TELE
MDVNGQGRLSCLDNNHTHFLLVDDGTHGCYGVEIELRTSLEKCIGRKSLGNSGGTIPAVCVILDGGPGTLNTIYNTMLNGTPCVILEGSGRIADVIAQVSGLPLSQVTIAVIDRLYEKLSGKILEWTKKIQDIIRLPHLLTIFSVSDDNHGNLDVAILQALLKASRSSKSPGVESWKRQLELAIAWNRVDIAEAEIFTEESQWKFSDLNWAMFSALVGNKPQFNNKELAEIAWEQCGDCISAALAASKILKSLAKEKTNADKAQEMLKLASHYEECAIGVFSECHDNNEERAQKLLVRVSPSWGGTTCLRLALEADDKSFVAQSGVQALLNQIWCGELSVDNPVWRVLICMIFFPLICTGFLIFRRDELIQRREMTEEKKTMETMKGSCDSHQATQTLQEVKPLGSWSRLESFYNSTQVKFYWKIVSYVAFLCLFALVLMIDFQRTPSPGELLLYIWLFTLMCEEVRQLFHDPDGFGFRKKSRMYIDDLWNILDVLSIILFCLGVAFRWTSKLFHEVKKMMMDMFFFMFLLSIWVVAYGVAKQGILIDNDNRLEWIVRGAIYEPYLIIFGNFPQNIDNAELDLNLCSVNGTDPLKPKCPLLKDNQIPVLSEWLTIIMLCVYLLFANILLLNLLIAIFNFTFQEVQDNTDRIWKFQRYELIKEYHSHPAAPPPFIILSHVWLFIRAMKLREPPIEYKEFKNKLPQMEEEELLSWEALMKDRYLLSAQQKQSECMERRILDTAQKVTVLTEQLEREEETSSAAVLKRLTRLEEQSSKTLQLIMDNLKSQGASAKETQPLTSTGTDGNLDSLTNTSEIEKRFHVKARQFRYPDSKITRFPVPEEKVPWEVSFPSYKPPYYDCKEDGCDIDGSEALEKYRNPEGRTGIRGRGALSRLGPNRNLDLVLTRWRDSERSVLEFLGVWGESREFLVLPGGLADSAEHLPAPLKKTLGDKIYETLNAKFSEGIKVFEGYVDDCRNTDNAWVETTVLNIYLPQTSEVMVDIENMSVSSHGSLQWQEVSSRTRLDSNQNDSLKKVAALHNRAF